MTSRRDRLGLRMAVLQEQMGQLAEEIGRLATRPAEPMGEAGDTIRFTKKFRDDGRSYSYVARRGVHGTWFVSGRVNTGNKTWDELLDFIEVDDPNALATVEVSTRWKRLVKA